VVHTEFWLGNLKEKYHLEGIGVGGRIILKGVFITEGTTVAQWLRCCATNRKVAGSSPAGVSGFFIDIIFPIALWPWCRLSHQQK